MRLSLGFVSCLALTVSACELEVYSPLVTVVGDSGRSGDEQSGDGTTFGDRDAGDPGGSSGDPGLNRPNGAACSEGTQCQSTICVDDVCCNEACDGLCEECNSIGTCVMSVDDEACGTVDCDGLDSTCRDYNDAAERCATRGVCKISNSADCTDYLDASDVTPCNDNDAGTAPDTCDGNGACVGVPVVLARVGAFNIGDDTVAPVGTLVPVTGVGFQPEVIFFWWSGRTDDTTTVTTVDGRQHIRRGIGFTTGPDSERLVTTQAENSTLPVDADRMYREDGSISSLNRSRQLDGLAELASLDPDGFTLQVVFDAFSENLAVTYLALGGGAITDAAVGTFTSVMGTGLTTGVTQEITDVGFQPDVVFFMNIGDVHPPEVPPYMTYHGMMSIGAATGTTPAENAVVVGTASNGSSRPQSRGYALMGESAVVGSGGNASPQERGKLDAFLPNGFRIDWIELDDNDDYVYFYLAIQGGNPRVGSLLTNLNSADDIVVSGVGYQPAAAILFSRGEDEDPPDDDNSRDQWSVGAFTTNLDQWVQGVYHADLAAGDPTPSTRASTALSNENIYYRVSSWGGRDGSMALTSVDPDGFTCLMTDADSTRQRFVWFVTFGPGPP